MISPWKSPIAFTRVEWVWEKFKKLDLPQQAIVLGSLCYAFGFVITNLHLSSLGVVSMELFRFRYVATGFLFLAFVASVLTVIYVFNEIVKHEASAGAWSKAGVVFMFLVLFIAFCSTLTFALQPTEGNSIPAPDEFPSYFRFSEWAGTVGRNLLGLGECFGFLVIVSVIFTILGWVVKRRKGFWASIRDVLRKQIDLVRVFAFYIMLFAALGLVTIPGLFTGWARFTSSVVCIVGIAVLWYTYVEGARALRSTFPAEPSDVSTTSATTQKESKDVHPYLQYLHENSLVLLVPLAILYLYLYVIYPAIPQQLGGGAMLPVVVQSTKSQIDNLANAPGTKIYMIDRTSSDTILYALKPSPTPASYVQVANSDLTIINYGP